MLPKSMPKCWAIVPAAGIGSRMQSTTPKQYLDLDGRYLIEHSLLKLLAMDWVSEIVVAVAEGDPYWPKLSLSKNSRITTVIGGGERADSVWNALLSIDERVEDNDYVLVHDAARPCIASDDLEKLYQTVINSESGVILADKLTDTIKRDNGNSSILKTVPREGLWRALTPQMFSYALLKTALKTARESSSDAVTDEAYAVEQLGLSPRLIQGRSDNIKVTTKGDLKLASLILLSQRET